MDNKTFSIRDAVRDDAPLILDFIRKIANYEKLLHEVEATVDSIQQWVFDRQCARVIIAQLDGRPIGFALYFYNFSTFTGRPGLYLEDLFIDPEYRGHGYGKAMLYHLAAKAHEEGCGRMEWVCLDWNEPSIRFYKSIGARPMDEWTIYRLTESRLGEIHDDNRY